MKNVERTLISVKLEVSLHKSLKTYCEEKNITMTDLVRHLIVMELRRVKDKLPPQVALIE